MYFLIVKIKAQKRYSDDAPCASRVHHSSAVRCITNVRHRLSSFRLPFDVICRAEPRWLVRMYPLSSRSGMTTERMMSSELGSIDARRTWRTRPMTVSLRIQSRPVLAAMKQIAYRVTSHGSVGEITLFAVVSPSLASFYSTIRRICKIIWHAL